MIIRHLVPADAAEFRRLRLEGLAAEALAYASSLEEEASRTEADFEETIRSNSSEGHFLLGAFDSLQLAGFVGFRRQPKLKTKHRGDIWGMYVEPGYRGQGLGRMLLERAIEVALTVPGLQQLSLSVTQDNGPARQLYLNSGFIVYGVEKDSFCIQGRLYDVEYMQRFLR